MGRLPSTLRWAYRSIFNNQSATRLTVTGGARHIAGMIGPNGQKRPNDVIANAVLAARIATGEAEEEYADRSRQDRGRLGACARAERLAPERRREIARKAAQTRWAGRP